MKTNFFIEFEGQQIEEKQLIEAVKEMWKEEGFFVKDIKTLNIYYKPQESKFYYVVNDEKEGSFNI